MKVSRKSDYALRALMTLVGRYGQGPVSIRELAEVNDVPRRFLEHIMLELKSRGWVRSIPGRIGGFELAKRPEEITMGQIVRYFDGLIAPIGCVSATAYEPAARKHTAAFDESCSISAITHHVEWTKPIWRQYLERLPSQNLRFLIWRLSAEMGSSFVRPDAAYRYNHSVSISHNNISSTQ